MSDRYSGSNSSDGDHERKRLTVESELRSDIKELRQQSNMVLTELAKLTATLSERCVSRFDMINAIKEDVEVHGKHIKDLQRLRTRDVSYAAGAGFMASIIFAIVEFLFGHGGNH